MKFGFEKEIMPSYIWRCLKAFSHCTWFSECLSRGSVQGRKRPAILPTFRSLWIAANPEINTVQGFTHCAVRVLTWHCQPLTYWIATFWSRHSGTLEMNFLSIWGHGARLSCSCQYRIPYLNTCCICPVEFIDSTLRNAKYAARC